MTHKCDGVARFFDFIFAGGLIILAIMYPINEAGKTSSNAVFLLVGYYAFFALFEIGCVLRLDVIIKNCGFVDNILLKSIFYLL